MNAPKLAEALPYPIADGWLSLQDSDPAETELLPLRLPELSDGPHFWYAVQWFMFASIGLAGLIVFVRGDLRERRARLTAEQEPEPGPPGQRDGGPDSSAPESSLSTASPRSKND